MGTPFLLVTPKKSMKTLIFDIDGTLTDMGPIERTIEQVVRLRTGRVSKKEYQRLYDQVTRRLQKDGLLPKPVAFPLVQWIKKNKTSYRFVYATGGETSESQYILRELGLLDLFDLENSVSATNCRFSKKTGIPFRRIIKKYPDCIVIGDSEKDCQGAEKAKAPFILVSRGAPSSLKEFEAFEKRLVE
ncbi:MAG: Phosphoglycolate phosphatase [Microgenomates bacterium OLB22]|nr:MAG: Phosphoglycolate phosphatase [Microgenomates bacterium OLB22]